jgi:hypothetical protein
MKRKVRAVRIIPENCRGWISYGFGYPITGKMVDVETIVGGFREKAQRPKDTDVHGSMRLRWKYVTNYKE